MSKTIDTESPPVRSLPRLRDCRAHRKRHNAATCHTPRPSASAEKANMNKSPCFRGLTAAPVLLGTFTAILLTACAAGPASSPPATRVAQVTHLCKPQESVRFSCELHDHRLLSLCASQSLATFKGPPKDNPGYAYLVVGTPQGVVQYSYPPNPYDYKQHFYKGVSAHVIPYLFVTSEKGEFFFLSEQDAADPQGAGGWTQENLPDGWSTTTKDKSRACARVLEFDPYFATGVTHDSVWKEKERERLGAEKAKAKQP